MLRKITIAFFSTTINRNLLFTHFIIFIFILLVFPGVVFGVERFPPPQFDDHELPVTTVPEPRADLYEYLDVAVFLAALSLASYLALKRRSRRGLSTGRDSGCRGSAPD